MVWQLLREPNLVCHYLCYQSISRSAQSRAVRQAYMTHACAQNLCETSLACAALLCLNCSSNLLQMLWSILIVRMLSVVL